MEMFVCVCEEEADSQPLLLPADEDARRDLFSSRRRK